MKRIILLLFICSFKSFGQTRELIDNQAIHFELKTENDLIDFIVIDKLLTSKKPIFLFIQGSTPVPLFVKFKNEEIEMFGGVISNFNFNEITKFYHLIVISMPNIPIIVSENKLNSNFQYTPDETNPGGFDMDYLRSDYLENYVNRAKKVIEYLKSQKWIDKSKFVIAGHSQGAQIATKLALQDDSVTHLGLFSANPFGRIDENIRRIRLDAQIGKISWEKADKMINSEYDFLREAYKSDSLNDKPILKSWKSFSKPLLNDWLQINSPIYLAYGTNDITSELCDIIPIFFIQHKKDNLTLKRYLNLEHNFFGISDKGSIDYENANWNKIMTDFLKWINK